MAALKDHSGLSTFWMFQVLVEDIRRFWLVWCKMYMRMSMRKIHGYLKVNEYIRKVFRLFCIGKQLWWLTGCLTGRRSPSRWLGLLLQASNACCIYWNLWITKSYKKCQAWLLEFLKWAATRENQQCGCAPSADSDQPGHPPSLVRLFT